MKTDQWIEVLASEASRVDLLAHQRRLWGVVLLGTLLAGLAAAGLWGPGRFDASVWAEPMVWWRWAYCLGIAVAAGLALSSLSRPGGTGRVLWWGVTVPYLSMAVAAAHALGSAPEGERWPLVMGQTALVCPWNIAVLSVPAFLGGFWVLRQMAPTEPRWAGTAAGLLAGALGALGYTVHCNELAAPFLAVWYALGMTIPAAAGAWLGPRLLRW